MDAINVATNNCVTPCGHSFCFQCLAKALEQNNTCPYCRTVLMEEPEEEEEEDDYDDDESEWSELTDADEPYDDNALASFRMLCQRLDGEDVESEEEVEEVEETEENDEVSVDENETDTDDEPLAEVEDITAKLQSRGITMLDLVAMLTVRKSANVAKHTDRFINALDSILDNAITDCDREAKAAHERQLAAASVSDKIV